ncbi:MAG: type II toxin-antitoxin system prevent-host-death family antitoxin [Acidobacteria bacterium]|nr:MAG: type II toxin-antitoxin system prevent-host-death family antitoxin [Acidobacteriota bacterium]
MEKPVSATDANRKFSKLLRAVREGKGYVVTSHGKAVARIVPAEKDSGVTRGAKVALLKRLGAEPVIKIGRWSRDELYEDKK